MARRHTRLACGLAQHSAAQQRQRQALERRGTAKEKRGREARWGRAPAVAPPRPEHSRAHSRHTQSLTPTTLRYGAVRVRYVHASQRSPGALLQHGLQQTQARGQERHGKGKPVRGNSTHASLLPAAPRRKRTIIMALNNTQATFSSQGPQEARLRKQTVDGAPGRGGGETTTQTCQCGKRTCTLHTRSNNARRTINVVVMIFVHHHHQGHQPLGQKYYGLPRMLYISLSSIRAAPRRARQHQQRFIMATPPPGEGRGGHSGRDRLWTCRCARQPAAAAAAAATQYATARRAPRRCTRWPGLAWPGRQDMPTRPGPGHPTPLQAARPCQALQRPRQERPGVPG